MMNINWKIVLSILVMIGGIIIAILSDDLVCKCIGFIMSILTFVINYLTGREIQSLHKKAAAAVYGGEEVGTAPDINSDLFKK